MFISNENLYYEIKWLFFLTDQPKALVLDIVTQAGAYIKELIHGDFGRTKPSISSIIKQDIDIITLDVNAIDLEWPPEVTNKLVSWITLINLNMKNKDLFFKFLFIFKLFDN